MKASGRLRIGDDWNAITIIALSQQNPLKAVAEFVENSIDAGARNIIITRGRERGQHFLRIRDDGKGIPRDEQGQPDFRYVATHICDSIKRRLKSEGVQGLQGEFGIGLLSFWTVGEELLLTSSSVDGRSYQMLMRKGGPTCKVTQRQSLFAEGGTELMVRPLLPGVKNVSGEKIQWFLASELRDRIRQNGVQIRIVDRTSRSEHKVEPRAFEGRLLHELPKTSGGIYVELYLNRPGPTNVVALYRGGTRVLENIAELELFRQAPWTSSYLQGIIDAAYVNLTPGTRTGVIHDEGLTRLAADVAPIASALISTIAEQQRAEEEQASREILRSIERALKEALLALPAEEYDWFNLRESRPSRNGEETPGEAPMVVHDTAEEAQTAPQKQFFDFPGPLFSVRISPASSVVAAGQTRPLRALARDRAQRIVDDGLTFEWTITEGEGRLENEHAEIVTYHAPSEPGLTKIRVLARQREVTCEAQALITVVQELLPSSNARGSLQQGIPAYTFERAPGQLWRSRFDAEKNVIVVNSGHRDFVYASRSRAVKIRYICRLYAKELVLKNFPGLPPDQLIERLIELTLYTEENLK